MPSDDHPRSQPRVPAPAADAADLRVFLAVAVAGSIGGAAQRLGRTQPAVTARLQNLERAWSTRLFRREARGTRLTPEGARLLPLAESALRGLLELDRAAGLPATRETALRVGAGDAIGRERLPRALARLARERPGLEIRVREATGAGLLDALRDGEIDLAIVIRPSGERVPPGLDLAPCLRSEVALLLPRGVTRTPRKPRAAWLDGRGLVVLQRGSGFRRHLESAFAAAGVRFNAAVEVGNLSLVRRFVAAGLGAAPVPAIAFPPGTIPGVERRPLVGVPPLAYDRAVRAGAPLPADLTRLLELL